jgi:hypothetical protein
LDLFGFDRLGLLGFDRLGLLGFDGFASTLASSFFGAAFLALAGFSSTFSGVAFTVFFFASAINYSLLLRGWSSGCCSSRGGCGRLIAKVIAMVAGEGASRREFAELVPYHILRDVNGDVLFAIVDRERKSDECRIDGRTARPSFDDLFLAGFLNGFNLFEKVVIHKRAFFART